MFIEGCGSKSEKNGGGQKLEEKPLCIKFAPQIKNSSEGTWLNKQQSTTTATRYNTEHFLQVKSLKPQSSLFHLPMLNQESNIKTKMLPVGWKADDMARYGSSMATPPRVRRTSFPESSQPTDGGGATHNHYIRQPPEPTNKRRSLHPRQFKGSVPWSTAFAQGLLVFSYVVFLWYPLGTVHNGLLPSPFSLFPCYYCASVPATSAPRCTSAPGQSAGEPTTLGTKRCAVNRASVVGHVAACSGWGISRSGGRAELVLAQGMRARGQQDMPCIGGLRQLQKGWNRQGVQKQNWL